MLAKPYKQGLKLPRKLAVQPKLDGVRCLAYLPARANTCKLYSRAQKPLIAPHVAQAAVATMKGRACDVILDGELYVHGERFQNIQSMVSAEEHERKAELVFCVYDVVFKGPYFETMGFAERFKELTTNYRPCSGLEFVETYAPAGKDLDTWLDWFIKDGYEGLIIRDAGAPYEENSRRHMWKYKRFLDAEFKVVGVLEGSGKNAGTAVLVCQHEGQTFRATAPGNYDQKAEVWQNPRDYVGRRVTIRYQETTAKGLPRFPCAVGFRED